MKRERPFCGVKSWRQCGIHWGVSLSDILATQGFRKVGGWVYAGAPCLAAAENSRVWADECGPSTKPPLQAPFGPKVSWRKCSTEATRHMPSTRTSPAPTLWQPLCSAGCEGHKDESRFCLSRRRHRVRWVWGHVHFPKQEVACSWNLRLVQKL